METNSIPYQQDKWHRLRSWARKHPALRRLYHRLKKENPKLAVVFNPGITEITPLIARASALDQIRLNLLVPSVNPEHTFGGISTALNFFQQLREKASSDCRIILTDAAPPTNFRFLDYTTVSLDDADRPGTLLLPANDRYGRTLPVRSHDIFVATSWWSAYHAQALMRWQRQTYGRCTPLVYLIQDFEPGFYAWSSHSALADATYRSELPVFAVFNSSYLRDYFLKLDYRFDRIDCFEPQLNLKLKALLSKQQMATAKKKQILVYGRPSVSRNAFELIVESLRIWVWKQPDITEWSIVSAGEPHPAVDLGNGKKLTSVGKLTLEAYAQTLAVSAIGLSLMISPHPSYPPMEMAAYGMGVLTNRYGEKNLSDWHENIVSAAVMAPQDLSAQLLGLCERFRQNPQSFVNGRLLKPDYLGGSDQFAFLNSLADQLLSTEPGL